MLQEQTTLPNGAIIQGRNGERYVIEAILGQGGFSAVYRVRERHNKQQVFALKEVIDPNPQERRNLAFEAEILMRLDHRALPRVYQVFENIKLNRIFMLMDFIDGKNLEILRQEQPDQRFSLSLALTLMTPIVDAVSYLHNNKRPIVHRDIKPANIIVPTGAADAKLVDFGLAKEYVEDKTTSVFRYGTPGYAAPEQYGQGTNQRTDIYALGATLYTLLTGFIPADALTRSINQQDQDPFTSACKVCPAIPEPVSKIIDQAMSLRSAARFASVDEFWRALCIAATAQKIGAPARPDDLTQHKNAAGAEVLPKRHATPDPLPTLIPASSNRRRTRLSGKQKTLLWSLLALILVVAGADGVFLYLARSHQEVHTTTIHTQSNKTHTNLVHPTPTTTMINPALVCEMTPTQAQPTPNLSLDYPPLAPCYEGFISDQGVTGAHTPMYLTRITQDNNGNINGWFRGLQLNYPFTGTFSKKSSTTFTFHIDTGSEVFVFEGNINVEELVGSFTSYSSSSYYTDQPVRTGHNGIWQVQLTGMVTPTVTTN